MSPSEVLAPDPEPPDAAGVDAVTVGVGVELPDEDRVAWLPDDEFLAGDEAVDEGVLPADDVLDVVVVLVVVLVVAAAALAWARSA